MSKKRKKFNQKEWDKNPKNPKVVFNNIVAEPISTPKALDKEFVIGLLLSMVVIILLGVLKLWVGVFVLMMVSSALGLMNALANKNSSAKIFGAVLGISLVGVLFIVLTNLPG